MAGAVVLAADDPVHPEGVFAGHADCEAAAAHLRPFSCSSVAELGAVSGERWFWTLLLCETLHVHGGKLCPAVPVEGIEADADLKHVPYYAEVPILEGEEQPKTGLGRF